MNLPKSVKSAELTCWTDKICQGQLWVIASTFVIEKIVLEKKKW